MHVTSSLARVVCA